MPDSSFAWLAQVVEGIAGGSRPAVGFWVAVGLLFTLTMGYVLTRLIGQMVPRLDPIIKRYGGLLTVFAVVGFLGYAMGLYSIVLAVSVGSVLAIGWLERRPTRNPRRSTTLAIAAVIALAIGAGAVERSVESSARRSTRFCLLLSFESTSVKSDEIIGAWVQFARTWHDVFADVPGVTITPPAATEKDYDTYLTDTTVKTLAPDIVLKTRVMLPGQSIRLASRVYEASSGHLKETDTIFVWEGAIAAMEQSALTGAASLLRHLHTLKDRPLSDKQHAQAARNLLGVYAVFLRVQGPAGKSILDDLNKTIEDPAAAISDDRIDVLLRKFDVSAALEADANKERDARGAALAKLAAVR
jgi:hypothetical protein